MVRNRASVGDGQTAVKLRFSSKARKAAEHRRVFRNALARATAATALIAACPALAQAGGAQPTGGTVVSGSASIAQSATTTNITQSTNKAIINWQGFSVGSGQTVNFNQPSAASATLNRVIGNEKSVISGALNANGQVFIVNSAGVIFTRGAQVNVGGLVASTLDISNADFMAGNYTFSGTSTASVINKGNIHARAGGYVALLGNVVSNSGTISATLGTVAMASGQMITLNFEGNSLVDVSISQGTYNALVQNKGLIKADGGRVILSARAADAVLSAQVNNSGIIQARTLGALTGHGNGSGDHSVSAGRVQLSQSGHSHGYRGVASGSANAHIGSISLIAYGGTTSNSGTLDASAPHGGNGGTIETSGDKVMIADSAVITTKAANGSNGTWLIDPDGFTIAATGGDITGTQLSSELGMTNVAIRSIDGSGNGGLNDGKINVNDVVSWTTANSLTLTATNAIDVNAVITAPNGGLVMTAGTDININAPSSLQVGTLVATATGNVNINGAQTWSNNGTWTFSGTNINVNDTVNWSDGTLTFNAGAAGGFINVNAVMTASNNAQFVATYNTGMDTSTTTVYDPNLDVTSTVASATYGTPFGGFNFLYDNTSGTFTGRLDFTNNTAAQPLTINTHQYALITNMTQLAAVSGGTGYYALASDLNASGTTYASAVIPTLAGTLEGLGHAIDGLTIDSTASNAQDIGLIGGSNVGSVVRDISLANASITAKGSYVGTLVGANRGTIINAYSSGTLNVTALTAGNAGGWAESNFIGGLVGQNQGIIVGSQANVAVTTIDSIYVGGFVGDNVAFHFGQAIILNSASYGAVSVTITNQNAASFQINNDTGFGGFVGTNEGGVISTSSSSGAVTAQTSGAGVYIFNVGGFVGDNDSSPYNSNPPGVINNSVSTSTVTGDAQTFNVGGFVGLTNANFGGSFINNSSAFGLVQGLAANNVGGFAGQNYGVFNGNTFNPNTTGQQNGSGYNYIGPDASATTATGPSSTQGAPQLNAAQQAADARSNAQTLTQAATAQQGAVANANASQSDTGNGGANISSTVSRNTNAGTSTGQTGTGNTGTGANNGTAQQAGNIGSSIATTIANIDTTPTGSISIAGTQAVDATAPNVDSNFVLTNVPPAVTTLPTAPTDERRRRVANTNTGHRSHRGNGNGGFGASIRGVDVNGQHFDLNGGADHGPH